MFVYDAFESWILIGDRASIKVHVYIFLLFFLLMYSREEGVDVK